MAINEPVEQLVPKAVAEGEFDDESVALKETVEVEVLESLPAPSLPQDLTIVPEGNTVVVKDPNALSDTVDGGVWVEE